MGVPALPPRAESRSGAGSGPRARGWLLRPSPDHRGGSGPVLKPRPLRPETSLPIVSSSGRRLSVQRSRVDFQGFPFDFPALRSPSPRRTKGHRIPGHQKARGPPPPTAASTPALSRSFWLRAVPAHAPHVISQRRSPAPPRFRLLECPRDFEQVLQRGPLVASWRGLGSRPGNRVPRRTLGAPRRRKAVVAVILKLVSDY